MITDAEIRANRKTWTDALRSGKYRKGLYQLRDPTDAFDCFGVFCNTGVVPGRWMRPSADGTMWKCDQWVSSLSELSPLQQSAVWLSKRELEKLEAMNDGLRDARIGRPCTFDEIAEYIDALPIQRDPLFQRYRL